MNVYFKVNIKIVHNCSFISVNVWNERELNKNQLFIKKFKLKYWFVEYKAIIYLYV